ncbi:MAG: NAD(+)/NADH kinase [Actinomycetota bacterium]|nr:NAD(+)/NADH kinase [Actinomycetota bacterium]
MTVRRVEIVSHPAKAGVEEMRGELESLLKERDVEVTDRDPEVVLSLGGDGTVLRAAQHAHAADALLLGINFGLLGYLTEVEAGDERDAVERVLRGDFAIEERMMLECHIDGQSYVGLNEVLVERSARQRLVNLAVDVGGERLASFGADGVLVATPTGSTAYALSAGGPIVDPRAECLVVVPVSPHMIFSRPVVLSAREMVEIEVQEPRAEAVLSLDGGLGCELKPGARVRVHRHDRPLRFIRLSGPKFLQRLRAKLRLPE